MEKIARNAATDFGRKHSFSKIHSLDDFRKHVPITDYEYYRPWIERLKKGDLAAMYGPDTRVLMFALTSGTTSQPKFIPITNHFFREYRRGWNIWGLRLYWDHKDLVVKKTLKLASDWQQFFTEARIPCGNISGLVTETAPWVARSRFLLPSSIIKIHNPFAKHYTALRLALVSKKVGMIGTANPSTLVEFARMADAEREYLVRDIFDGGLREDLEVPSEVRRHLSGYLRKSPRRARELEGIIRQYGRLYFPAIWPELSVLAVWMGGSVRVFLPLLEEYYGKVALRDHGLSASEGHMSIPFEDGTSSGILEYCHHFFEFIPEEEYGRPQPTVLEAHELEEGKDYYILLTTSSGLYRYDIRDVVRCTGFVGEVPLVEFRNKGAHFSSFTGEKLTEAQVIEAVQRVFKRFGWPAQAFTVAPVMGERPQYVLLLEPGPYCGRQQELAVTVNAELAAINCEYANRLETRRVAPLRVQIVPPGTFRALRLHRTASRGNFEEYKHPCLVADLDFIDRLLEIARKSLETPKAPVGEGFGFSGTHLDMGENREQTPTSWQNTLN